MRGFVPLVVSMSLLLSWPGRVFGQTTGGISSDNPASPLRSPSGHFLVEGPNPLGNQVLMLWAEQITTRAEQVVGCSIPFEHRSIRIVIRPDAEAGSNAVSVTQERVLGHIVQRLFLPDYGDEALDRGREPLCRLLLNGFVIRQTAEAGKSDDAKLPSVPRWLSVGVSENLYPVLKARNSGRVLNRWRTGQLIPIGEIVKSQAEQGKEPDEAVCGTWVTWILSQPDRVGCFRNLFERLAAGETVSAEWLVPFVPNCQTITDLDEQWDKWILQQKRTIYDPGLVTASFISQLETELTLYPGEPGLPQIPRLNESIGPHNLVSRRKEAWIPAVAQNRVMRLRVLSTGRGKELQAVVESYCRFFESLGSRWTRTKTVEELLIKAESDLARLRHLVEEAEREGQP